MSRQDQAMAHEYSDPVSDRERTGARVAENDARSARAGGKRNTGSHSPSLVQGSTAPVPATAQRLLQAARTILERHGYHALSLESIATEAGENKALIRYYFGSKAGLLIALVEWLVRDQLMEMQAMFADLPEGAGRLHALVEGNLRMVEDSTGYRLYFELVPNLLRDSRMRAQLAGYFAACRQLNLAGLVADGNADLSREAATLAAMTMALADGLALQRLADQHAIDFELAWSLWEGLVRQTLLTTALAGSRAAESDLASSPGSQSGRASS